MGSVTRPAKKQAQRQKKMQAEGRQRSDLFTKTQTGFVQFARAESTGASTAPTWDFARRNQVAGRTAGNVGPWQSRLT
jgi:hypothetical protein